MTLQSNIYAPRVIIIIDKAILRGHLEYLVMRKGELGVVTWKECEKVDGERRVRSSPGAFLKVCRSAGSPAEGKGCLCMTEEKGWSGRRLSGEERKERINLALEIILA
jgi:hypothetical protein